MKEIKKVLSLLLVMILVLTIIPINVYADEYSQEELEILFDSINTMITAYTLTGTVTQVVSSPTENGVIIELDTPLETPIFTNMVMKYAFIRGDWGLSVGDTFSSTEKFAMIDFNMVDLTTSIGAFEVDAPPEENYYTEEETEEFIDWIGSLAENSKSVSPNTEDAIFYEGIYLIDEAGSIEEGMDPTLLRLYVNNPGYLYIAGEPPIYDEYTGEYTYLPLQKKIKDFNRGQTISKNNTYYFPMREVLEYYGFTVNWDATKGTTISDFVSITPGSSTITTRGVEAILSNPIEVIDGVTYVPIDFLQKAFPENQFKWETKDRGNGCTSIDITQGIAG